MITSKVHPFKVEIYVENQQQADKIIEAVSKLFPDGQFYPFTEQTVPVQHLHFQVDEEV